MAAPFPHIMPTVLCIPQLYVCHRHMLHTYIFLQYYIMKYKQICLVCLFPFVIVTSEENGHN
jgi:hypothetical protein